MDTRYNEWAFMRGHPRAKRAFISYGGTPDGFGRTYEPAVPRRRAVFGAQDSVVSVTRNRDARVPSISNTSATASPSSIRSPTLRVRPA